MELFKTISSKSSSGFKVDISNVLSQFSIPHCLAIYETVPTLSPEITLISTSLFLNQYIVSLTSGLMLSLIINIAIFFLFSGGNSLLVYLPSTLANNNTRSPSFANSDTLSRTFLSSVKNSGAPKTYQPNSSNSTPENLRALENSIVSIIFNCGCSLN